ncbi:MAG: hypothetical protein IJW22_01275 [Clostridia bacterium]|nr:hypothetical protein [Clostridia bacterium]
MEKKTNESRILRFFRAKGKLPLLVCGAVLGVLLLVVGASGSEKSTQGAESSFEQQSFAELERYKAELERELETLCASVAGVSQVEVMVTLSRGARVLYATDADGDPAKVGTGSAQEPLYRTVEPPAIAGIGVVCRGGGDPNVAATLCELLSTSLGISSNRVFIAAK